MAGRRFAAQPPAGTRVRVIDATGLFDGLLGVVQGPGHGANSVAYCAVRLDDVRLIECRWLINLELAEEQSCTR